MSDFKKIKENLIENNLSGFFKDKDLKNFNENDYINCGFYLISSKAIGTPEGGWKMGFEELLPDLIETKIIEPTSKQIENQGREIQKALDCNPYCSKYL